MKGRCTIDHEKSRPRPDTRVHATALGVCGRAAQLRSLAQNLLRILG